MTRPVNDDPKPRRGRPRDLEAKQAILAAATALLEEGGPGAVTMEAVAARAGVGKPTVYRWWPDRHAVAMAALMAAHEPAEGKGASRNCVEALQTQLRQLVMSFASPTGRHIASMLAAADAESELTKAFRGHFVLERRAEGRAILEGGMETDELRAGLDLEVALDQLYGPVFFRLLVGHEKLDSAFIARLLEQAMTGMRPR